MHYCHIFCIPNKCLGIIDTLLEEMQYCHNFCIFNKCLGIINTLFEESHVPGLFRQLHQPLPQAVAVVVPKLLLLELLEGLERALLRHVAGIQVTLCVGVGEGSLIAEE